MKHAVLQIAFRVVTVIWATAIGGLLGANISGTAGSWRARAWEPPWG